ncbi:hypothetical protein PB1E_1157 [Leuconostoc gelidum subsp. gasicomitatum]|nr:hypothetical protein PB1E_1157 [Leuconostoc gasicomitatum]
MLNQDESNPDVEKFDKKQNRLQFKQNNTEVLIEQNEPIEPDKIITKLNALVSQDNK